MVFNPLRIAGTTIKMHPIPQADYDIISHALLNSTKSISVIAQESGHSRSTVYRIAAVVAPNMGKLKVVRQRKLTDRERGAILKCVATGRAANATQAAHRINTALANPVSIQTMRNVLKEEDYVAVVKKKKPFLSAQHRRERLKFAMKYAEWTVEDWKTVIWSDETKINRFWSDRKQQEGGTTTD